MSSRWIADVESSIFTAIEYRVRNKLGDKYPELFFTRESDNDDLEENVFPTCYIWFSSVPLGADLSGQTVNAVRMTMEIQVSSSKSQGIEVAKDVIYEVFDNALQLAFCDIKMSPEYVDMNNDVKRMVARVSRVIGYNDVDTLIK